MTVDKKQETFCVNKYNRTICDVYGRECVVLDEETGVHEPALVDVYCVLIAFDVKHPAIQHANKKTLCAGIRGKGDERQDLMEAIASINRRLAEIETESTAKGKP